MAPSYPSPYSYLASKGGYPILSAGPNPANVVLAKGSTSSASDPKTFTSPTGGSNSYTLAVTLAAGSGSSATLAGDNSTGWYATNLVNGDTCEIRAVWTDSVTGQTVTNAFLVQVTPSGASWVEKLSLDLTGLDTLDMSVSGVGQTVFSLTRGGNAVADVTVRSPSGMTFSGIADTAGITMTWVAGTSGEVSVGFDMSVLLPSLFSTPPTLDELWGDWAFSALVDIGPWPNVSNQRLQFVLNSQMAGVSFGNPIAVGVTDTGATGLANIGYYGTSDGNAYLNVARPTLTTFTQVLTNGVWVAAYANDGTYPTNPELLNTYGPILNYRTPVRGTWTTDFTSGLWATLSYRRQIVGTLKGLKVYRKE